MAQREVAIGSRVGLHARPAALFVQAATAAGLPVRISKSGGKAVDARSIISVLSLGARNGDVVTLEADGEGDAAVLDGLVQLLQQDLDDPAPADA